MSSKTQIPEAGPALAPEVQEYAIGILLNLQGIAASPSEMRSASRALRRLDPQAPARPLARTSS